MKQTLNQNGLKFWRAWEGARLFLWFLLVLDGNISVIRWSHQYQKIPKASDSSPGILAIQRGSPSVQRRPITGDWSTTFQATPQCTVAVYWLSHDVNWCLAKMSLQDGSHGSHGSHGSQSYWVILSCTVYGVIAYRWLSRFHNNTMTHRMTLKITGE